MSTTNLDGFSFKQEAFLWAGEKTKEIQADCIANGLALNVEGESEEIEDTNPHQIPRDTWGCVERHLGIYSHPSSKVEWRLQKWWYDEIFLKIRWRSKKYSLEKPIFAIVKDTPRKVTKNGIFWQFTLV